MANPFDEEQQQSFLDPNLVGAGKAQAGMSVENMAAPPQQGQFANSNQGFLDWATQKYGADPNRGSGFVDANAGGGFENILKEYGAATGNTANFQGGQSGDRVDFGQGTQDALTSGGQIWNAQGGGGGGAAAGGSGGGGGSRPPSMPWSTNSAPGGGNPGGNVNVVQPYSPVTPGADVSAPGPYAGAGAGSRYAAGPMSEINSASRQGLLDSMKQSQQPVSMQDPAMAAQSEAYSSARNRAATQQRSAMAERAAASGLNSGGQGSGSFNSGLNSIYGSAGRDIAGNDAGLMGAETAARRQQLMQSLQMATSVGARDEANDIQGQLANMDQEFRFAGLNQQGSQNQQDMELRAALANQGNRFNYDNMNQQGKYNQQGQLLQQEQGNQGRSFDYAHLGQQGQLGNRGLDVQQQLGNRGFDLEGRSLDQGQSQWDDRYGLDKARLGADVNRDAMMAALMGR